jgi:hypothetical protein
LRHCATSRKVAGSIPDGVIDITLPAALWPWGYSASDRNKYQEYFLGVKAAGAWGLQSYHLHVPTVLKSGSLNFLETSGTVAAYVFLLFSSFLSFLYYCILAGSSYAKCDQSSLPSFVLPHQDLPPASLLYVTLHFSHDRFN